MGSVHACKPKAVEKLSMHVEEKAASAYAHNSCFTQLEQPIRRLRKRQEFRSISADHVAAHASTLVIQCRKHPTQTKEVGIGYTVTKRVGGAVVRNRVKRRLRAIEKTIMMPLTLLGYNYVVIAKPAIITIPYEQLGKDMQYALKKLHHKMGLK